MSCRPGERRQPQVNTVLTESLPPVFTDPDLLATAIVRGVRVAGQEGRALRARLSLAATAHLLGPSAVEQPSVASVAAAASDLTDWQELTPWGPARRLRFPITINGNQPVWPHPAGPLRSAQARWLSA